MNRKQLLALPHRGIKKSEYDTLYLVPNGHKHDSGYMCIAVVGVNKGVPVEIAATPDSINWTAENPKDELRMDCLYPSGIIQTFSSRCRFEVSADLSSVEIRQVRK